MSRYVKDPWAKKSRAGMKLINNGIKGFIKAGKAYRKVPPRKRNKVPIAVIYNGNGDDMSFVWVCIIIIVLVFALLVKFS